MARKLTPDLLKKIIREEKSKLDKDKKKHEKELTALADKTPEVDADKYADTLEQEIDFQAALKIKEAALLKSLRKLKKLREASNKRIAKLRS